MAIYEAASVTNVKDACRQLLSMLPSDVDEPPEHSVWQCEIFSFDLGLVLGTVRGVARVAFKSRDADGEFVGLGIADVVKAAAGQNDSGLVSLMEKAATLFSGQVYFGAIRFDEDARTGQEWQAFGKKIFILPLVFLNKKNARSTLSLNYRVDGPLSWRAWRDHACSLLEAISKPTPMVDGKFAFDMGEYLPRQNEYSQNIRRALSFFANNDAHKKVVIGRRNAIVLKDELDPVRLFVRLKQKTSGAFLFFLDCDGQSAFFGASPELLYRRLGRDFETESLAGTRPRSSDLKHDAMLRDELISSFKDNQEHALVSLHVEEKLRDFGTTDLFASKLEIMALTYVQHLLKRYHGTISKLVDDRRIIEALHPTPAVCGIDTNWAKQFIRENESFDRGFYAGPIGYIGKDEAEFAVGIRSALFQNQRLYIYAACGIVPGSVEKQEWEELNNKEKNILSIFSEEKRDETE